MKKTTVYLLISFCVTACCFAQTDSSYLKTHLEQLHHNLDEYISNSPNDKMLERLEQSHYWLHALATFSNLGTLSVYEPIDKLSADERAAYDTLAEEISAFISSPTGNGDAKLNATKFVSGLPVLKRQFVLNPLRPLYFFQNQNDSLSLTFTGQFPALLPDTEAVFLFVGNHRIGYSQATDSTLTFVFTPAQLGLSNTEPLKKTNIKLHLVGQLGKKINPKKQFKAVYDFYALSLPSSPGKLTITQNTTSTNVEKQSKRTRTFLLNGSKGNLVEKQCLPNHDGWSIVPESITLVVESSKGVKSRDWDYRKTSSGGKYCYTAEVFFNSSGPSGKLEYHIKYDIKRSTTEETTTMQELRLNWGEARQEVFEMDIVKITYTDFTGTEHEIVGDNFQSHWLQLKLVQNVIAINTPMISSTNAQP